MVNQTNNIHSEIITPRSLTNTTTVCWSRKLPFNNVGSTSGNSDHWVAMTHAVRWPPADVPPTYTPLADEYMYYDYLFDKSWRTHVYIQICMSYTLQWITYIYRSFHSCMHLTLTPFLWQISIHGRRQSGLAGLFPLTSLKNCINLLSFWGTLCECFNQMTRAFEFH